jgi:hypothetical protein
VVRVKRDILRRSSIGVIATNRSLDSSGTGSNQAGGVDANFAFFQNVNVGAYYAGTKSDASLASGDNTSYRAQFDWSPDKYGVNYEYLKVGEAFRPDTGFMRRQNFRRHFAQARYSPRPRRIRSIRKLFYEANVDYITNHTDDHVQSRLAQGTVRADLQSGDMVEVNLNANYEDLPAAFTIAKGVVLPTGGYGYTDANALFRLGPQRRLAGDLSVAHGQFYDGTHTDAGYSGRVEVSPRLSVEPRISISSVHLREGDFVTKLLTTRATFTMTPRMFASGLVQYNSSTSTFSANVRLRWEYRPGSDFFVVYSEGRDTTPGTTTPMQNRGLVVKMTRLFRF